MGPIRPNTYLVDLFSSGSYTDATRLDPVDDSTLTGLNETTASSPGKFPVFASTRSQASQRIGLIGGRRWEAAEGTKRAPRTRASPSIIPSGGMPSPARASAPSCGTYTTFSSSQTLLTFSLFFSLINQ